MNIRYQGNFATATGLIHLAEIRPIQLAIAIDDSKPSVRQLK
jgi:hypothetical protein